MNAADQSSHPLISMIDEVLRLGTRLQSLFAGARSVTRLAPMEAMVLSAVVRAAVPPTVPQIGRSLGHARQVVQRAANALIADGLIATRPNPDHKRAPLLVATAEGLATKALIDRRAVAAADALMEVVEASRAERLTEDLRRLRHEVEAHLKAREASHPEQAKEEADG